MSDGKPIISSDDDKIGGTSGSMSNTASGSKAPSGHMPAGHVDQGHPVEYNSPLDLLNSGADAPAWNHDDGHDLGHDAAWDRVALRMRRDIGEAAWRNWIKPLRFGRLEDGTLTLEASSTLARERVTSQYADRLRVISAAEFGSVRKVAISLSKQQPPRMSHQQATQKRAAAKDAARSEDDPIGAGLDPRYTFANFIVGKPNELAFAVARRTAESASVAFNPLFLYGGVGLGKTHLMHAIAWHIREQDPSRHVVYLSAEKFMYRFVQALRFRDTMSFKEQFRSVDVLMIDDVQFISGKDSTQEEFFHTFNALVDRNRQVIISADKSPTDLEAVEERLRSRLGWGLVADIHPTTYELRLGILQSKAEKMAVEIPGKVLEFLAHKIASNVRELEGAMNRIVAHSTLVGREITLESTQEVLHDLLRANDRRVTVEEIQKQVAGHYNIRLNDMYSARRARAVARPRQVAMYLSKKLTPRSLPEIGRKFGGRDHTTVMHAVKRVEELRAIDRQFAEDLDLLRRMLES